MATRISEHFLREEFACNHCGELPYDPPRQLLEILEDLRAEFDSPVIITSGYRCPIHNRNVGGVKHSRHLEGDAADVKVKGVDPHDVYVFLDQRVGSLGGVGKYNSFTHVDTRGARARW
ncbi:D-Ala-D-Ala carboxypeptidase family metallohydrolase [Ferrimonas marina]|uniref:Peptidase M15 n=1 Tax=Ferrimonas marina TaxID=299255 RepID=A0A1M5Z634_9GAMM|nr:D-Ala-D-Ala carboxypeptidase family metallohydrolase [Ferrimonas marina]SHI19651.1 Peptidase M15 [Ferrimonas marina]